METHHFIAGKINSMAIFKFAKSQFRGKLDNILMIMDNG